MSPTRDRERISALTVGLAATIITWTFAVGYAPATLETLSEYSPWLYGPVSTLAWAVFSASAYLLIHRSGQQSSLHTLDESYRCHDLGVPTPHISSSVCANRDEKNHLAAVTAGFALTITAWIAALSLMPADWLDSLSVAPAWSYCASSVGLWAVLSTTMYHLSSAADQRPRHGGDCLGWYRRPTTWPVIPGWKRGSLSVGVDSQRHCEKHDGGESAR